MRAEKKDFRIAVDAWSIVDFLADGESYVANKHIRRVFDLMEVNLNPGDISEKYFDNSRAGTGDFHLHKSRNDKALLGVDYYRDYSNQSDALILNIRTEINIKPIQTELRHFYDGIASRCQYFFHEAKLLVEVEDALDESRYPLKIRDSHDYSFEQTLVVHEYTDELSC